MRVEKQMEPRKSEERTKANRGHEAQGAAPLTSRRLPLPKRRMPSCAPWSLQRRRPASASARLENGRGSDPTMPPTEEGAAAADLRNKSEAGIPQEITFPSRLVYYLNEDSESSNHNLNTQARNQRKQGQAIHLAQASFQLEAFGSPFILDLFLNSDLLSSDYVEIHYEDGRPVETKADLARPHIIQKAQGLGLAQQTSNVGFTLPMDLLGPPRVGTLHGGIAIPSATLCFLSMRYSVDKGGLGSPPERFHSDLWMRFEFPLDSLDQRRPFSPPKLASPLHSVEF
ncbi:ADA23 protein, partial [Polypterus senegalus]